MKKILFILAFISFHSMANFSGHWVNENDSQSLTLDLVEDSTHLAGKYCFITNHGNRIDCSEGNDRNINGVIKDNVGVVDFKSTFGGIGQATISIERDLLKYTITNLTPFVNANMSVPKVILFKKTVQVTGKKSSAHEKYDADVIIRTPTGGSLTFSQKKMVNIMRIIHGAKFYFPIKITLLISVGMTVFTLRMALQKSHPQENT